MRECGGGGYVLGAGWLISDGFYAGSGEVEAFASDGPLVVHLDQYGAGEAEQGDRFWSATDPIWSGVPPTG